MGYGKNTAANRFQLGIADNVKVTFEVAKYLKYLSQLIQTLDLHIKDTLRSVNARNLYCIASIVVVPAPLL